MTERTNSTDSSSPGGESLTLTYEPAPVAASGPRPWWVYAVVGAYLLLLAVLLTLPAWAGLLSGANSNDLTLLIICVVALVVSGFSLILVPVRKVRRRPVTRRSIWVPILGSGFLAGVLVLGAGLAVYEYLRFEGEEEWVIAAAAGLVWLGWAIVFGVICVHGNVEGVGAWLHRWLIAGSALELLVAVPCHIVVRRRNECCAGIGTGLGICFGVVVMFIAFGPSVVMLFHRRRKQIKVK